MDCTCDGWDESAGAWLRFVDGGDPNRTLVLDHAMLSLVGDVRGAEVLDVGCGEGRFCRMLTERGAVTTGLDPTEPLLATARERHPEGEYCLSRAESMPFAEASFDLAVSFVTLCDIADYRRAVSEMARVLRPGGRLAVAIHNPFVTTSPTGWRRNERGDRVEFPVDHYTFESGSRVAWRGIQIVNYHRPLSDYMRAFLGAGLRMTHFEEPLPSAEDIGRFPDAAHYLRIPYFIVMEWRKG